MNTHAGYSKKTLTDTNVLLTGGGDKSLADFLGGIQYVSASHKILIKTAAADASWTDLVTLVTTDENVKLTPKTDNANRPLMMINGGTSAGELTSTSMFSAGIYANASTKMIIANGFVKADSDSSHVLLGDGGHKALNDFAMASDYVKKSGDIMTGALLMGNGDRKYILGPDISFIADFSADNGGWANILLGIKDSISTKTIISCYGDKTNGLSYATLGGVWNDPSARIYQAGFEILKSYSITPLTNNTYDCGSSTRIWANVYSNKFILDANSTNILLANGTTIALSTFSSSGHTHAYLPLSGGVMTGSIGFKQSATSNYVVSDYWLKGGVSLATYDPQIGLHNTGGDGSGSICILPYATESAPWGGTVGLFIYKGGMKLDNNLVLTVANSSVSKSGETLTVNIGGTSLSLTNTWRGITDSYSGTDSTISLSQKGSKALYDALLNGYASSAGNSDTVDGYHADSFLIKRGIRSDLDDLGTLRYNFGGFDRNDYNGTYKDLYPVGYGQYISLQYSDSNTAAQMFFECPAWSTTLGHVYVRTRGAGTVYDYSAWGVLAYTTDNVASATKLLTARTLTIGNTGKTFNGTADVSWTLAEIGAAAAHSHPYLPTAGGTMTGDITMSGMDTNLNWNVNYLGGWARDFIVYNQHNNNNSSGALVNVFHLGGYGDDNGFQYAYIGTASYDGNNLRFNKDGTITIGSGTVWHSNNDGSGSGLDADTLDGYHASSFLTSHLTVSGTFWGQSWSNGGTVNGHITMSGEYGLSGYMPRKKDGGGGWAYSLVSCRDLASTVFMLLGVYGGGNTLSWIYLGSNSYDGNNLRVYSNGNTTAPNFYTYSDRNKKLNITMFSEHIRKFQLKDSGKYAYGVIAQEVPEMFRDGEEGNMTVNYNSILSFYIGQLENKVKMLEERIKRLESK